MPPRTAEDTTNHRINNLAGLFGISLVFFVIVLLAGNGGRDSTNILLLWAFGLLAGVTLALWWLLAFLRLNKRLR